MFIPETGHASMLPVKVVGNGELAVASCICAEPVHPTVSQAEPQASFVPVSDQKPVKAESSYGQILKSSAWIGGSQAANIALGIVRTKAMAILLGPAGFGLFGLYGSVSILTQNVAGMGINSSGVRQIAEAVGSGDKSRIGQTTAVLRRASLLLGLVGAALMLAFSRPIANLTFGSADRSRSIALLSLAVLFTLVANGQGALVQGMRRIADLAKMNVLGAVLGVFTSIPLVYFFRERGIVPALVVVAGMQILTFWWYSRKVQVEVPKITLGQSWREASLLLQLGFAFMASGLMTTGIAYFVRVLLLHKDGIAATGLYQCAWTLGGLYVGFVLQAMGADFYPRLTSVSTNNAECNRLVNEQALVGLLLAGPGVIATLTFAPLVIALFYSAKFGAAVPILRWITLGVTLQVITWPMGFIILAKGRANIFFYAELAWTIVAAALGWLCVTLFGATGAGAAFFGAYVFHGFLIYPIVRWMSGFRWSRENRKTGLVLFSVIALVFCGFYLLPLFAAVGVGSLALIGTTLYSWQVLINLLPANRLPTPVLRVTRALGLSRSPEPSTGAAGALA